MWRLVWLLAGVAAIPPHQETARVARFVAHMCDWGALATISTQDPPMRGQPFANVFSISDGPVGKSSGVPYMYLTELEISVRDLKVNANASLTMSLAQTSYCKKQGYDPQDPLCAHVIFYGVVEKGSTERGRHDGRQPVRMGGTLSSPHGSGTVVSSRAGTGHQLVGIAGRPSCPAQFRVGTALQPRVGAHRQYHHQGAPEQTRGHTLQTPDAGGREIASVGQEQFPFHQGRAHLGRHQCASGLAQQGHARSGGMAVAPLIVSGGSPEIRPSCDRPVRFSRQYTIAAASLRYLVQGAENVNALRCPWPSGLLYAFPPLPVIPRLIQRVLDERAEIIVVAPHWPRRPWFADLRSLSIQDPWRIPSSMISVSQGLVLHPDPQWLSLAVWRLSGNV
uniref:CREG-like beta-barrel domain-containing protein n=1 Tax=Naja naja TaxID=35670 RepID=A0A8C6VFI0_NAJNA